IQNHKNMLTSAPWKRTHRYRDLSANPSIAFIKCLNTVFDCLFRSESKMWSPLSSEEGKTNSYKMNLASEPQEVKRIGSAHNRSALPFAGFGPKVVTNQYNNPAGLYSSENIKDFNATVDGVRTIGTAANEPNPSGILPPIVADSEVYKMLQENQEADEPPRQSASFKVLQDILESGTYSHTHSVKAPATKIGSTVRHADKLPICDKCGSGIVGMVVKLRDKFRHPECYTCSDCDLNLKQKGHFFVEDQIYCEKHARERVTPPEGYDVVTVFPK
uniref:PDZ and LIM domain 1 (elfin) n=1 Tax=Oncorhynchus tshawytscha TaxID=74940 RepID=A0AAZ3PBB7_ONCTS